jgi:phosphodiesterase/alkaline phosphatase D-like protein
MRKITVMGLALLMMFRVAASAQRKAQAERITNGPVVKKTTGTVAEIAWSTDAPGSSIVEYGTSPNALNQTAEAPWGGAKEPNGDYNHTVWVKNLKPNTAYYFVVEATQGAGTNTQTQSQPKEFHTMASK